MAKKNKNDYFQMASQQVEFSVKAADLLAEILANYTLESIPMYKEKMHVIENNADELYHDIHTRLSTEFITPIDQEDILHLVQIIDDVTDAIDEVVLYFYMYNVMELPTDAVKLCDIVRRCVKALSAAVNELKNFKKPDELRKLMVEVNSIESEADAAYAEAIHNLFVGCQNTKKLIANSAIYESLEDCCDLCEHASDVIGQIIIKNT